MKFDKNNIKFFSLCFVLIFLNPLNLQTKKDQIQYKIEVKEKLLYLLVLDKKGNPINDLKKEDFQLFVDGKPQEIKTFSLIKYIQKRREEGKLKISQERIKVPKISDKEMIDDRRFILAILPSKPESIFQRNKIGKAIKHLIKQAQYPRDWIGIVILDPNWIATIQDFTCSKEKLLKKFDAYLKFDMDKFKKLNKQYPLTSQEIFQVPLLPIFQGTIRIKGGIDIIPGLEIISEKLGILNGRKIILCFGLPLLFTGPDESDRNTWEQYNNRLSPFYKMINKINSHNITIYYSEIRKPGVKNYYDASSPVTLNSEDLSLGNTISRRDPIGGKLDSDYIKMLKESSHFALANETGGKYYYNISSPTYFIDDVIKMNSRYYLVSFPITEDLERKKSHSIKLKCKREGVKLYYSNKYYAPHELEEKKFEESYKKIQLYKYLVVDTYNPTLEIEGAWIPLPGEEAGLQVGFIDFYLPPELFQKSPLSYQLGASYATSQRRGIFFQEEVGFSSPQKDKGYRARALVKFTGEGKTLRLVAMDSESGNFGKIELDIGKTSGKTDFSDILLGNLVDKKRILEFRDYSEDRYNLKKYLYKLLALDKKLIIPSVNNTFSQGEKITFCLIHKISEKESKRYKNVKVVAYLSLDKEGQITEINLPVSMKKVEKHYRKYYGTIDTSDLKPGKYRIEIDLKDANNSIIVATDAYFEIKE
jgi:VWFA-related protein